MVRKKPKQRKKPKLTKRTLGKLVRQNKSTRVIANYFQVSERTIYRRIKTWNLKGIRPLGRKPIEPIKIIKEWILADTYVNKLNRKYRFGNIIYLPTRYINTRTRVCSDQKQNPKGKFTTCTIYYVGYWSVYWLYAMQIRVPITLKSFDKIYHYFSNRAYDLLTTKLKNTEVKLIDIVAFHFFTASKNHVVKGVTNQAYPSTLKKLNRKNQWGKK